MADNNAYCAVVDGVIAISVEEWRLEDGGREHNLVALRVIVGVHGLRCHEPLVLVDRLAYLGHLLLVAELVHRYQILCETLGGVYVKVVLLPLVRVAHLDADGGQLLFGLELRAVAHPCQVVNALAERNAQLLNQINHALLGALGEVFSHVEFAEFLTHAVLHGAEGALPEGAHGLHTAQLTAVEVERRGVELAREA